VLILRESININAYKVIGRISTEIQYPKNEAKISAVYPKCTIVSENAMIVSEILAPIVDFALILSFAYNARLTGKKLWAKLSDEGAQPAVFRPFVEALVILTRY